MPTEAEKLHYAMLPTWPVEIASEYFDLSPQRVIELVGAPADTTQIDRFKLEKKLLLDDRIGLEWFSLSLGVPLAPLAKAMYKPPKGVGLFPLDTYKSEGHYLIPRKLAEAWVRELLPKNKTWGSLDGRARELAKLIGCSIRECTVSKRFGEEPAAVATCRCIVTWDDISRAHSEYVDNGKSITLEPDAVGWHAIVDKKLDVSDLWRPDLRNMNSYLAARGVEWEN